MLDKLWVFGVNIYIFKILLIAVAFVEIFDLDWTFLSWQS